MNKSLFVLFALCAVAHAQLNIPRTRTRTTTTTTSTSTFTTGTRQFTLSGGQILNIDARTLQRLQRQGVDINNLQNLSEAELEELGISLRADTLIIPGAVIGADGLQTITLRDGAIFTIDDATLARIRAAGIRLERIQNLTEAELEKLGISLRANTLTIPGAVIGADGLQTITLRDGIILTIDDATLARIRAAGIRLDQIQNLTEAELRRIGVVLSTETIALTLEPGATRTIRLRDGKVITVVYEQLLQLQEQGIDIDNLQALSESDLERLGLIQVTRTVTVSRGQSRPTTTRTGTRIVASLAPTARPRVVVAAAPAAPRPPPPPRGPSAVESEEANPAPEPFNFEYTAETEDGASSTHQATQTAEGVVTGFYIIKEANGNQRRVDYIADKDGYRATVSTNEIGTESKNPADVEIQSSAPLASELSKQYTAEQERLAARRQPQPSLISRGIDQRRTALASNVLSTRRSARIKAAQPQVEADFESVGSATAAAGIKI